MIDIHADDYGETLNTSKEILDLCSKGLLDSISILPNMSAFDESIDLFKKNCQNFPRKLLLTVHLNFMEGHCMASKDAVKDLVDGRGFFSISWGQLFFASYNPFKRTKIKAQLKKEISAQIDKIVQTGLLDSDIRIDSHQHTHLIPVVQDALYEVITEGKYNVTFLRNSSEYLSVFLRHPKVLLSCRPVNFIKFLMLNTYGVRLVRKFKKLGLGKGALCGIFMSGCMDKRVSVIYNDLQKLSDKKNERLELLFHPGRALPQEIGDEFCKPDANEFFLSSNRNVENAQVRALNHCNG